MIEPQSWHDGASCCSRNVTGARFPPSLAGASAPFSASAGSTSAGDPARAAGSDRWITPATSCASRDRNFDASHRKT